MDILQLKQDSYDNSNAKHNEQLIKYYGVYSKTHM